MSTYFDEQYYLQSKLKQLSNAGSTDPSGHAWNMNSLQQAISDAGMTPESHYQAYGTKENLNPNSYFNESEYLDAKLNQLHSVGEKDANGNDYTLFSLIKAIKDGGMSVAEHYENYGAFETNAKGEVINPSNAFDANAYYQAKLQQIVEKGESVNGKPAGEVTVADVIAAIHDAGLSPVTHYIAYGAGEAGAQGVPLVQTVPVSQRVPNDLGRETVTGELVPGNYNPGTVGAGSAQAGAHPVAKPADVGGKAPESVSPPVVTPTKPLPVPGDDNYVKPPASLVDTNEKPVLPPTTAGTGNATDDWAVLNPDGSADLIKPDGTPGGSLPPGSIDPENPVIPDVKPVDPTPDPGPDPDPDPDPTPDPDPDPDPGPDPEPEDSFTVSIDANKALTFGGTVDPGAITYAIAGDTVTFTSGGKTATVTKAALDTVTSVTVGAGQTLAIADADHFAPNVTINGGKVSIADSKGTNTITLYNTALTSFADSSGTDTIKVKGTVDMSGAFTGTVTAAPDITFDTADATAATLTVGVDAIGKVARIDGGAGSADTLQIKVAENAVVDAATVILVAANANKIENVNFVTDAAGSLANATVKLTAEQLTVMKDVTDSLIGGVAQVQIAATAGTTNYTFDAAGMEAFKNAKLSLTLTDSSATATTVKLNAAGGAVDIILADAWDSAFSITGGTGNDIVNLSAAGTATITSGTIDMGAGNDSLTLTDGSAMAVKFTKLDGGAGTDTLILKGDWSGSALDTGATGAAVDGTGFNFEVVDLGAASVNDAYGFNLKFTGATAVSITGSANNDQFSGSEGTDTIAGGNGADWIRGNEGVDTIFAGKASEKTGDLYAESEGDTITAGSFNAKFMEIMNGAVATTRSGESAVVTPKWMSAEAIAAFTGANILEGAEGDDILVASNAKDVFLFQTGGDGSPHEKETTFEDHGKDTIHQFNIGEDLLFLMDQDTADDGGNDGAQRGFSTDWVWKGDGSLESLIATEGVAGAVEEEAGITADSIKLVWGTKDGGGTDYTTATITIDGDTMLAEKQTGKDLVIELVGIQGATSETTLHDFFDLTALSA